MRIPEKTHSVLHFVHLYIPFSYFIKVIVSLEITPVILCSAFIGATKRTRFHFHYCREELARAQLSLTFPTTQLRQLQAKEENCRGLRSRLLQEQRGGQLRDKGQGLLLLSLSSRCVCCLSTLCCLPIFLWLKGLSLL